MHRKAKARGWQKRKLATEVGPTDEGSVASEVPKKQVKKSAPKSDITDAPLSASTSNNFPPTDASVASGDTGGMPAATAGALQRTDYDLPCDELAKSLLGHKLVRLHNGKRLSGYIVETEAYMGLVDKAAHSYKGRTARNEAMFMEPGTAYVYSIYGIYVCMNVSAKGDGAAVLLRALEPCENLEIMDKLRTKEKPTSFMKNSGKGLCNGPSKLCQALGITKNEVNQVDLCSSKDIWIEKGIEVCSDGIVECKRINIDYAEDWVDKPLRFYTLDNNFVSVRNKDVEKSMKAN